MELLERDDALAVLSEAHGAAAAGTGRAVIVTGEPGIGKTSLVTEFVRRLGPASHVLVGRCDDLTIPRPLGPLLDLPIFQDGLPPDVPRALLDELAQEPYPSVLVLEDVHWTDDATLDVLTVVARRITSLPALVVATCRTGEAPTLAIADAIRATKTEFVALEPLSPEAVAELAGDDAADVYAATRGNPFFVTELLASRTATELPPSIASAVIGRASRLDEDGRRLLDLVAVVPSRTPTTLLDAVMPGWPTAAEDAERRHLLELEPSFVRFRHELARSAIESDIPAARKRVLHAQILDALLAACSDPADIVYHAEGAGNTDLVAACALTAARRAAALASNREALRHYRRAADFLDRLTPAEQAELLEELADATYVAGFAAEALPHIARAREIHRELGDSLAVGRCTRVLSRVHWAAGDGAPARELAHEALAILEPLGESTELARAYSGLSQLAMLEEDQGPAIDWAEKAIDLAVRFGDEATHIHALVNIGSMKAVADHRSAEPLLDAHAKADAAGERHEANRALAVIAYSSLFWVQPRAAERYVEQACAYAVEYDERFYETYVSLTGAWLCLRSGDWAAAERILEREGADVRVVSQLLAKLVGAELAVRRGDPDAGARLADVRAQAFRTGELQRIAPVLELETVAALTDDVALPVDAYRELAGAVEYRGEGAGCSSARTAAWAAVCGVDMDVGRELPPPFDAMLRRDWRAAADTFGAVGWTFDRALLLSLLDDEDALVEAIEIARGLGAAPLTRRVTRRMRELGVRVPRGASSATRSNPLGLTARQLEVLALVVEGHTNAEIAERLVVSPRTAEHHVAAVLTKLGASTRREAAQRAAELGV
jgi:DNA-binding CsgD family transcriptional regulator/tetratricopeptide (TPR) repeat protein